MSINIVLDTETTGLLPFGVFNAKNPNNPRIVQFGAILFELSEQYPDGKILGEMNFIIKPDGWKVPKEAADVHGISTEMAEQFGVPVALSLNTFNRWCRMSDNVIAHNINYDKAVIEGEFARLDKDSPFVDKNLVCTMKESTEILKLPGKKGFKSPKLIEAHKFFLGCEFSGAHDAMADVRACKSVYIKMLEHLKNNSNKTSEPANVS